LRNGGYQARRRSEVWRIGMRVAHSKFMESNRF
jgi:hypothetical protein